MRRLSLVIVLLAAATVSAQDMPLSQVLVEGEGYHPVEGDFRSVAGLAADAEGNVYVADPEGKRVLRVGKDGKAGAFARTTEGVEGLAFGPDGLLYGCQPGKKRIVALGAGGTERVLVEGLAARDLVFTRKGTCYCTVPGEHAVYRVRDERGTVRKDRVAEGIREPSGLVLWPDEGTLVVGDAAGKHLYAFRVEKDGGLSDREGYYTLRVRPKQPSGVAGLAEDTAGRVYAATREGVQVFDPTGRLSGVLLEPRRAAVTAVAFGGVGRDRLFIGCGGKVYYRKTKAKGLAVAGGGAEKSGR